MKHIYLNLKRFDIPTEAGGVNRIASPAEWGPYIVSHTQDQLAAYNPKDVEFAMFFPEAHLIGAVSARKADSALKIGPQSVLGQDTAVGGNFGAFTSNRTGNAMKAIGCDAVLIGHCEERRMWKKDWILPWSRPLRTVCSAKQTVMKHWLLLSAVMQRQ